MGVLIGFDGFRRSLRNGLGQSREGRHGFGFCGRRLGDERFGGRGVDGGRLGMFVEADFAFAAIATTAAFLAEMIAAGVFRAKDADIVGRFPTNTANKSRSRCHDLLLSGWRLAADGAAAALRFFIGDAELLFLVIG